MGSVHLRTFFVTDTEMYKNSTKPREERREEKRKTKRIHIEPLLQRFPKRKFIFVGDSGEEDPEVYAQLARMYPDQVPDLLIAILAEETLTLALVQVKAIFIRRAPYSEKRVSKIVSQTRKRLEREEKEQEKREKEKEKKELRERKEREKMHRKSMERPRKLPPLAASEPTPPSHTRRLQRTHR